LDTNVLVSGIFFGGIPRALHDAWVEGRYELLVTPSIFDEYIQICERLAATRPSLEYRSVLATVVGHGTLVPDTPVPIPITADADDDKFMACAAEHGALVISGDPYVRDASGWHGVRVFSPRAFMTYLDETGPGVE
jgi:predicted nucleic acid-binding protein